MPTPLTRSTGDSFNSAATIVPDDRRPTRVTRSSNRNPLPDHTLSLSQSSSQGSSSQYLSAGRRLGPNNSFERRINRAIGVNGGEEGLIGLLQTQQAPEESGWGFLREQSIPPEADKDDMALDPRSSSPPAFDPTILPHDPRHPGYRHTSSYSSASVASSCDNSDLYSTTDIDTDDEGSRRPSVSNMGDLGLGNIRLDPNALLSVQPSPSAEMMSPFARHSGTAAVSPQDIQGDSPVAGYHSREPIDLSQVPKTFSGPTRTGKRGAREKLSKDDDEAARAEKLEHRRDINRRSAQKHRARRKEESEIMAKLIAGKDAKIRQLENELAAERARNEQLRSMWNQRFAAAGQEL
ncbi:hypothetical protein IAR50_005808 [Cryptococcus sp. DSM 104548]